MTQTELQAIAREKLNTAITPTQNRFCNFDGFSDDYVIEFKCRRAHYDTQLIEHKKFMWNIENANESGKEFLYVISTPKDVYIFNVSKLLEEGYDFGWEDRIMPDKTDFDSPLKHISKKVGYINVNDAVINKN